MATITAEAKLYNGWRLLCVDKNITANITATFTTGNYNRPIQPNNSFNVSPGILPFKVLRTAAGIEVVGGVSLTDERYATYGGGNKAGVINPAQPWTISAGVACKFPTYVRFDLEALGVPEGTNLILQMEEGFVIEGDYPGTERKPLSKVSNLLSFRTPKKFAVYPSVSTSLSVPTARIRPFAGSVLSLFSPNFSAIAQRVGYIELYNNFNTFALPNFTAISGSVMSSTLSQSANVGYLRDTSVDLAEMLFDINADNVRVRYFDSTSNLMSAETATDGDRIRFGVSNNSIQSAQVTTTLDSRRRNTSSAMTAVCSITASLTIPVTETVVIDNPEQSFFSRFATSLSIDGNNIVVGDAGYPENSGTAYIFNATTGALVRTLANPNPVNTPIINNPDEYGISSDIDGNYAVVGAWYEDGSGGSFQGRAYLFDITTGALLQSQTNPNSATDYYFGLSVAIDGNQWAAGQERDGVRVYPVTTGTSYVLSPPNSNDRFFRVAISGNNVIITVRRFVATVNEEYKLYHYTLSPSAQLVRTINNPNPITTELQDYFGWSLSVYGNYALIGAPGEGDGRAYVFDLSNGNLLYTFSRPAGTALTSATDLENFGKSVDMNDRYAVIADNDYVHLFDYVAGYHERSIYVQGATEVSITDNKFVVATSEFAGKVKVFSF